MYKMVVIVKIVKCLLCLKCLSTVFKKDIFIIKSKVIARDGLKR
jgi:hypothetical protein